MIRRTACVLAPQVREEDGAETGACTPESIGELYLERRLTDARRQPVFQRPVLLHGTAYVAWGDADTHRDDQVEAVVRAAAGRLVLLSLPTSSPWLTPIEMLRRHFRRVVTHCELFETMRALLTAARECFDRFNQRPRQIRSVIGSNAAKAT